MKKLIAMTMVLVLALVLGCSALAESADEIMAQQESWLRESLTNTGWTEQGGDRITLDVEPDLENGSQFTVQVTASNGALESVELTYFCDYDLSIHVLNAKRLVCNKVVYADENAEDAEITCIYDRKSEASFELDEEGMLVLRDTDAVDDEYNISLMYFTKVPGTEKGQEMTEETRAACEKAISSLMGVSYTPLRLLAEKDGRMCVLCEAAVVAPGAETNYALLYIDPAKNDTWVVLLTDDGSEG